jgi:hypothetical protein
MQFPEEGRTLVFVWCEKWLEFLDLINTFTPDSLPPEEDTELHYQRLRFWFLDHQESFLPLWKDFRSRQTGVAAPAGEAGEGMVDLEALAEYRDNPFAFFYEPENLFHLGHRLGLQPGKDTWEPTAPRINRFRPVMFAIGGIVLEFDYWMSERTGQFS